LYEKQYTFDNDTGFLTDSFIANSLCNIDLASFLYISGYLARILL